MENLTKTQIVLLAILISFVVSIATGIVTVSLLEQAPGEVPQTINRVIQQTIEKVTPTETKTIIVKEEDLVVGAIEANEKSLVNLFRRTDTGEENLGLVFIVSKDGFAITEKKDFSDGEYFVKIADRDTEAKIVSTDAGGFTVFKITLPKGASFSTLGDANRLRAGQTLVFLGETVTRGTFVKQDKISLAGEEGEKTLSFDILKTAEPVTISPALVLDLDGKAVGLAVNLSEIKAILPSNILKDALKN
jgi:hypothetical protein